LKEGNTIGVIKDALELNKVKDREQFIMNIDKIQRCKIDNNRFRLDLYTNYYCDQDVNILRLGFEKLREDLMKEFGLDVSSFISISSLENNLLEREVYNKNGNIFELANAPREFISKCELRGR
jgi:hypothetical protein